jgi:hypothetical protein
VARWVSGCLKCNAEFTHSEISADDRLPDTFLGGAPKPDFPAGGLTLSCPNCGEVSVYERHQLRYRAH